MFAHVIGAPNPRAATPAQADQWRAPFTRHTILMDIGTGHSLRLGGALQSDQLLLQSVAMTLVDMCCQWTPMAQEQDWDQEDLVLWVGIMVMHTLEHPCGDQLVRVVLCIYRNRVVHVVSLILTKHSMPSRRWPPVGLDSTVHGSDGRRW